MEARLKIALSVILTAYSFFTVGAFGFIPAAIVALILILFTTFIFNTADGLYINLYDVFWSQSGNLKLFRYYDKLEHGLFYIPLAFGFATLLYWLAGRPFDLVWQINASLSAFFLGLAKELYDSSFYARKKATVSVLRSDGFSLYDLYADIGGVVLINIILIIYQIIF